MRITYISHSCFTVEIADKIILFDYPSPTYLEKGANSVLIDIIEDSKLIVFFSHGHGDHFDPNIQKITEKASSVEYILSDDMDQCWGTKLEPKDKFNLEGIEVRTFASNDAGLAYLIDVEGKSIYYGGDLAKWDWDDFDGKTRAYMVRVFEDMLDYLSQIDLDVAFSNVDQRLSSWGGPLDFLKKVKPRQFVPMHTFGNKKWIDDLIRETEFPAERIFRYSEPGDHVDI